MRNPSSEQPDASFLARFEATEPVTLEDVVITDALETRRDRPADHKTESNSMMILARQLVTEPEGLTTLLARKAVRLCGGGSAGVSLLETLPDGSEVFRWVAMAGKLESAVGGSTPRHFSPCGTCLDRGSAQLFDRPGRYFTYLEAEGADIQEALVLPFSIEGRPVGTIWVVTHDANKHFDAEDARLMTQLATFTGLALQVQKLSERARAQATILDHVQDSVIVTDISGRITGWNRGASEIFGYSEAEVLGKTPQLLYPDQPAESLAADLQKILRGEDFIGEWKGRRRDGTTVWLNVRTRLMKDAKGARIGFVGLATDVSDRKHAEVQLRRNLAFEQKLIGIVSHDLGSPMLAISLSSELALNPQISGHQRNLHLKQIHESSQRARRLIRDWLELTQVRLGGELHPQRSPMDLASLASDIVDEMAVTHPARQLRVEHQGDARGEWDAARLSQVLTNLINNALQYSPDDSTVTIRTVGREAEVSLQVSNTGPSILPESLPSLFEPMSRGGPAQQGRLGLGLFIVDQIAKAHGGGVTVESAPLTGTVFTVTLPRRAPARI